MNSTLTGTIRSYNRSDDTLLFKGDRFQAWLPREEIVIEVDDNGTATITLPEQLAKEKGLLR